MGFCTQQHLRALLAASAAALLVGCASQPVSLSPKLQQQLGPVQTVLYIPQTNINVDVAPSSAGAAGGLLGALISHGIDAARRSKAEENSKGLVESLRDFGFAQRMNRQLEAEFARVQSVQLLRPVALEATDSPSTRRMAFDRSAASAVQFIRVNYALVDSALVVSATVDMYPKAAALMQFRPKPVAAEPLNDGNAVLRKSYSFRSESIGLPVIRQSLAQGIANVAWQIAAELNHVAGSASTGLATALPPLAGGAAPGEAAPASAAATAPTAAAPAGEAAHAHLQGQWRGQLRCGAYQGPAAVSNPGPWATDVLMTVQGNQASMVRGNDSYTETAAGLIGAERTLLMQGEGRNLTPPAATWLTRISGRFDPPGTANTQFSATAQLLTPKSAVTRDCTLTLRKAAGT